MASEEEVSPEEEEKPEEEVVKPREPGRGLRWFWVAIAIIIIAAAVAFYLQIKPQAERVSDFEVKVDRARRWALEDCRANLQAALKRAEELNYGMAADALGLAARKAGQAKFLGSGPQAELAEVEQYIKQAREYAESGEGAELRQGLQKLTKMVERLLPAPSKEPLAKPPIEEKPAAPEEEKPR